MKRKFFYAITLLTAAALSFSSCGKSDSKDPDPEPQPNPIVNPEPEPEPEPEPVTPSDGNKEHSTVTSLADAKTPADIVSAMGMGWNLGNQMDAWTNGAADEICWGNKKTTQEAFNKIAASGIKTVRIPVTWMGHFGGAPDYKIEAAWLDRVSEIVGYAENAGLNAIVNIHHDGSDSQHWLDIKSAALTTAKNQEITDIIKALWTQIAEKFRDKGPFLIFEGFNEIQDGGWGYGANRSDGGKQYRTFNGWLQTFVDAVRATGSENENRWLGIPSYCTNIDLCSELVLPSDASNKLMVAVHFYEPSVYTLEDKYTTWGHTGKDNARNPYSGKNEVYWQESEVKAEIKKMYDRYTSKGTPVYFGEMGNVYHGKDNAERYRKYYLEYVVKCMRENLTAPIVWDNGATGSGSECHGYFDHATGEYLNDAKEMIEVMVKAATNNDSDYTLDWIYNNSAPK
jgi:endoglucanase